MTRTVIRRAVEPRYVAEALPTAARRALVRRLVRKGLTDVRIAELTAMTTYTTARIRSSLGLAPNDRRPSPWPSASGSATRSSGATTTPAGTAEHRHLTSH